MRDWKEAALIAKRLLRIIPKEQKDAVFGQKEADIDPEFIGFVDIYKKLSEIIPDHFTVIDFGCAYNPQSYFFTKHKKYIAVDMSKCVKFKAKNCRIYRMTIKSFIEKYAEKYDKKETFAICSYVPPWHDDNIKLVRENFLNVFTYYPHDSRNIMGKRIKD